MNRRILLIATLFVACAPGGCRSSRELAPVARDCESGQLCLTGTVRHLALEGGFWAIVGDDRVTYDPMGGVPAAFQHEGMRVYLVARPRTDVGSIHMAGPIVEIVSIERAK
jgi:hypothetical protein